MGEMLDASRKPKIADEGSDLTDSHGTKSIFTAQTVGDMTVRDNTVQAHGKEAEERADVVERAGVAARAALEAVEASSGRRAASRSRARVGSAVTHSDRSAWTVL